MKYTEEIITRKHEAILHTGKKTEELGLTSFASGLNHQVALSGDAFLAYNRSAWPMLLAVSK